MKKVEKALMDRLTGKISRQESAGRTANWRNLTPQLFLVFVLPLTALLLVITFGSLALHQQAMRKLVAARDLASVQTASAAIREQAVLRAAGLRLLSDLAAGVPNSDLDQLLDKSTALGPSFEYGLAFLDSAGNLEAATGDPGLWAAIAQSSLPRQLASDGSQLGQGSSTFLTIGNPAIGEPVVVALVSSQDGSRITAGGFSVAALVQPVLHSEAANGHMPSFLLIDQDRRVLYRFGTLYEKGESPDHPGIAESLNGLSGTTYVRAEDSEHVVAYSPVGDLGWGLIGEEPWEMVDTPVLRNTQAAPLVLVPVLLLTLLALWFAARQIVRPLQELESRSARLAGGDFEAIEAPVGGIMEVRQLQSELIHMAHQLRSAQQSLHNYIGAITTAQEDERRRLARDLHDETIQSLIALKQQVQLAKMDLSGNNDQGLLDDISGMTEQTIEELRRLIRALRPIYLEDLGLTAALGMLAREMSQMAGIPVEFSQSGSERRLEPAAELSIYRIAQEALSNVSRHASAKHAFLRIKFFTNEVVLEVEDDGQGFIAPKNRSEIAPNDHYGVLGLFERAELIGANLRIDSSPGGGTKLQVQFPTDQQK
jgi:signal transduction histidine kinase